ncbi:hypothetical protein CB0940_06071 [Cercospora beticola]|uniref:Uncharacterized protein n=1 Tax=Cercospora beticola TaxID=122368 RepID=A0A2G5I123_CERBT|nr:hypothetical protein CB0940_06071 [Cercospora beticola]PIA98470.1 hypothetical protein CB0940_06071 [Cercospora beticola]WPA98685.1 hypothetical protein RHO25_003298 [Cercospora beticola]
MIGLIYLIAYAALAVAALQHRQADGGDTNAGEKATIIDEPECCWFVAMQIPQAQIGVMHNFWYESTATQTVATVVSDIYDYGDSTVTGETRTTHMPASEIYTDFGRYMMFTANPPTAILNDQLGIPRDMLPTGSYAATIVHQANTTTYHGITAPTAFNEYASIGVWTPPTGSAFGTESGRCGGPITTRTVAIVQEGSWAASTVTYSNPQGKFGWYTNNAIDTKYFTDSPGELPTYAQVVGLSRTNGGNFAIPTEAVALLTKNPAVLSAYPWITKCGTLDAYGEPTVHIAVDQLTVMGQNIITMQLGARQEAPSPTTSSASLETTTMVSQISGSPVPASTAASPAMETASGVRTYAISETANASASISRDASLATAASFEGETSDQAAETLTSSNPRNTAPASGSALSTAAMNSSASHAAQSGLNSTSAIGSTTHTASLYTGSASKCVRAIDWQWYVVLGMVLMKVY